jgi:hypothetical protein
MSGGTAPDQPTGPGFRKQATGCGCGLLVALVAAVPLCLTWVALALTGVWVPTWGDPTASGAGSGPGPLVVSTVLALVTVLAALPALFVLGMAHDSVHGRMPRRSGAVALVYVLPVLAAATAAAGWVARALGDADAARYLALGPWGATLGLVATVALVYSGAAAYAQT